MATSTTTTIIQTVSRLSKVSFSWYDYILFSVMLVLSALIGIYFGCFGSKQSSANEYLMGGKTMRVIPIAISLVASHTSGITLLALPADIYRYGAAYWLGGISMAILSVVTIYVYLPVFYNLQIISTYEYLERRFDKKTRSFASFLYAVSVFLYLPIVVYIPALAFSAASGIDVHLIAPVVCAVCIFYTTIGGLKAVVWTDTLQFSVTVGAIITVFILGVKSAGGFLQVWNKAVEGQRLDIFDFDLDPTKRDSFWAIVIGLTVHWMGHTSVNQGCVQKFLAVSTLKKSSLSVALYCFGMTVVKTFSVLTRFIMFAKYSDCDPFTTKQVTRNDQLLPYYVMDVARNIPGLSGLFIAGVFSAGLSTLSATLNCLAGTLYEDFISKFMHKGITEKSASNILKIIVIVTGVACTVLVFVIEHMGGLLKLSISLGGVTNGPLLGLFTLGMLFPRANSKGAFYGTIGGVIFISTLIFPTKYFETQGLIKYPPKPLSTERCDFFNETNIFENVLHRNSSTYFEPPAIFRISFYYYTLIGALSTIIFALIISYMTNKNDPPVDKSLISPVSHFLLPKDTKTNGVVEYNTVERALEVVTTNSGKENK
ncbi:sodium-coupled monocarboxylate transporter 2 [Tribolium castaneum]|uniref:sodium-coupled monocarboxylate transporter 2 n=1 Tax=Tribolium castaneum TaxID=7070 RepID=UPI00077D9CC7|nr:PREDICTED: sodium-coupled monocarboxylate transporter 2 [Tribolium castaneum]|eukprot:XP_015834034.1 PREDICTED: sodium-coupled monocarboxylate transporter 2 [Tribolium castaneum]